MFYLWSHIAQVEGVLHGLLTPLVIGCSRQVTPVEATPPVVCIRGSVEDVDAADETLCRLNSIQPPDSPVCTTSTHLSSSLNSQRFLSDGPVREAGFSLSITQDAVRVRGSYDVT